MYTSPALFLVIAAAVAAPRADAYFSASARATQAVTASSSYHAKFAKQWTLKKNTDADGIVSISLGLAGTVFVSHVGGLPKDVLGYVNVTGDSQTVVDAVSVRNDNSKLDNHKNGILNVTATASIPQDGYLLTEVFLASSRLIDDVETQHSTQEIIEKGVLLTDTKSSDLVIEATGSSTLLVSDTAAKVSVPELDVEASGSATIQLNVASVSTSKDVVLEAQGSASISLLASSLEAAGDIMLETQNSGTICDTR